MSERRQEWIAQLSERHVVRTAILYIGVAWLAAQVGDFWIQNYGLERRYLDVVLYALTVGLPAALIISWYHGQKGARVDEATGNAQAAIERYGRLHGMAGNGLRLIPWMADTGERLARLQEAEASRGES